MQKKKEYQLSIKIYIIMDKKHLKCIKISYSKVFVGFTVIIKRSYIALYRIPALSHTKSEL